MDIACKPILKGRKHQEVESVRGWGRDRLPLHSASGRSVAVLLVLTVVALLPGVAAAGGALFIKGGAMRLEDNSQTFHTITNGADNASLDDVGTKTIGLGWEIRFRRGWAIGIEYLRYEQEFTSSASPNTSGTAVTAAGLLTAKKYFFDNSRFHPYIGAGIGLGGSDYSNTSKGGLVNDTNSSIILHAALGVEMRIDHLSLLLEAKTLAFEHRNLGYDASTTGVLLGVGYSW